MHLKLLKIDYICYCNAMVYMWCFLPQTWNFAEVFSDVILSLFFLSFFLLYNSQSFLIGRTTVGTIQQCIVV